MSADPTDKEKFAVVTTVKDEGPFIVEWVAWHRMCGFDTIIVFQNDSSDGTHEILKTLNAAGYIKYFYNRASRGHIQVTAYHRASQLKEYQDCDYVIALDIDEFLQVNIGSGLVQDYVASLPSFDRAVINWKLFGCSGAQFISEDFVTEQFVGCEDSEKIARHFTPYKSLFRRASYSRAGIHQPRGFSRVGDEPRVVNGSGLSEPNFALKNFQSTDPLYRRLAQINHYAVKDASSFVLKNIRGSAHQIDREISKGYWSRRNKNDEVDLSAASRSRALRACVEEMNRKTNGRLERLTKRAVSVHKERFEQALGNTASAELYEYCISSADALRGRRLRSALDIEVKDPEVLR